MPAWEILTLLHCKHKPTQHNPACCECFSESLWLVRNLFRLFYIHKVVIRLWLIIYTQRGRQSSKVWRKFSWKKRQFTEGERTWDQKDSSLLLVVVTLVLRRLYLCNLWFYNLWSYEPVQNKEAGILVASISKLPQKKHICLCLFSFNWIFLLAIVPLLNMDKW